MKATIREGSGESAPPAPSREIVARANEVIRATDERGRELGIRRMSVLESARFFEMIGPENARNQAFLSFAVPAYLAVEIAGETYARPHTRRELDARLQLLDEAGIAAINDLVVEHWGDDDAAQQAEPERLKNGPGTPG